LLPAVSAQLTLADSGIASLHLHAAEFQILEQPSQRLRREILILSSRRASMIESARTGCARIADPHPGSDGIDAEVRRVAGGVDGVQFGVRL
jgi:hypothetical protein